MATDQQENRHRLAMEEYFNTDNCAAEQYERFTGKKVRIYYQDMKGTNRSLLVR